MLTVSALVFAAAAALLALAARGRKKTVLPRDFDFTRYKRFEQK
jgi:hypothetical protein